MKYSILLVSLLLACATVSFAQVGTLLFCSDSLNISTEDSLWTVEMAGSEAERAPDVTPPGLAQDCCPQPAFPDSALAAGIPGSVIAATYINKQGRVMAWQPLSIDPQGWGFELAVEKVICGWHFSPAMRRGQPVNGIIGVPFNFELEKKTTK